MAQQPVQRFRGCLGFGTLHQNEQWLVHHQDGILWLNLMSEDSRDRVNERALSTRLLLTGGATGIGRAIACACVPPAQVVVADVNVEDAVQTVASVKAAGGTAHFVRCDVTSEDEVRSLIATACDLMGGIDAVVTAAGVLQAAAVPIEEIDPADWSRTLEVNVHGSFYCVKHALPALRRSTAGVVILVGSPAGIVSGSSSVPYATSKGGVYGLSKALAPRLERDGIRLNLLLPGSIDTPLKRRAEQAMNAIGEGSDPVLVGPAGVAKVVRFLLSDEAEYVRGEVFTR